MILLVMFLPRGIVPALTALMPARPVARRVAAGGSVPEQAR